MIYINSHLEKEKTYQSHQEMFPKLYHIDFDGKPRLAGAKKKAAEAQETIDTIQKVMAETTPRAEALDIKEV